MKQNVRRWGSVRNKLIKMTARVKTACEVEISFVVDPYIARFLWHKVRQINFWCYLIRKWCTMRESKSRRQRQTKTFRKVQGQKRFFGRTNQTRFAFIVESFDFCYCNSNAEKNYGSIHASKIPIFWRQFSIHYLQQILSCCYSPVSKKSTKAKIDTKKKSKKIERHEELCGYIK